MSELQFRVAMTKKKLMTLPEGCWIVSGIGNNDGSPVLTAQVGSLDSRAELWARMRALSADGRLYDVLEDKAALDAHLTEYAKIRAQAERRRSLTQ